MFSYCNNAPAQYSDPSGHRVEAREDICGYGGGGGFSLLYPIVHLAEIVTSALGRNESDEEKEAGTQAIAEARNSKHQEFFPENPTAFTPAGLYMHVCVEIDSGKRGGIIKWEDPITGIAIFEWDQDYLYGPHYHVMLEEWNSKHKDPNHYQPGDPVPEPWNSIYFGG